MPLEQPATDADIRALYRMILKREAESEAVVRGYTDTGMSLADSLANFLACPEYVERAVPSASAAIWHARQSGAIESEATDAQLAALRAHVERVWSSYGEKDTYWSVITGDKYRDNALTPQTLDNFYASGFATYEQIAPLLARNSVNTDRIGSVLDFGCGVGRLSAPFAQHFGNYVGVDISPGHLHLARAHAGAQNLTGTRFIDVREFLESCFQYDLYFSLIVLQHNPPPVIRVMLREGLGRVKQGGYALFQIPAMIFDYSFSVEHYLAGGWRNTMEMHALPQHAVFAELAACGFQLLEVIPDPFIGLGGISYVYLAKRAR